MSTRPVRWSYRHVALAGVTCGVVGVLLAGCSSTPRPPVVSSSTGTGVAPSSSASATPSASAPRDPDFVTVGTAVVRGPHDSVTTTYEVGHAGTRRDLPVPAGVLADCGWTAPAVADRTVFVHGRMTVTYQGGVDQNVGLDGNDVVLVADPQTPPRIGHAVVDATGSYASTTRNGWSICDRRESDDPRWERAMAPGQTVSLEMWLGVPGVLAVAGTPVDDALAQALAISFAPEAADDDGGATASLVLSGRGAATCASAGGATNTLLLYATPPHTFTGGSTGDVVCRPFGR